MIKQTIFATLLLLCVTETVVAQEGRITGNVKDKQTGEPLEGVYVICSRNLGTVSDSTGYYSLFVPYGSYSVAFQLIGYELTTRQANVTGVNPLTLNIELPPVLKEIDQVVVSANRSEQKIAHLSVSMDIVKEKFITSNHITDAQELMNRTPGIEVMDGQASIRGGSGFSYGAGSRVMVLVDGLPSIAADAGNIKWQFLPLENLSQVEIIKGASSVLYGSSALNGVINFRTSDPGNIPKTGFHAETGIFGNPPVKSRKWWDTPRVFSSASFSHLRRIGKNDYSISANLLTDEGYRRLNGEKAGKLYLKFRHSNGKIKGLTYGINVNSGFTEKKDFILWENAEEGALKQSPSTATEFHGNFLALDPYISLKRSGQASHDIKTRVQNSQNRNPDRPQNDSDVSSFYSEYQYHGKPGKLTELTAGATLSMNKVESQFFGDHNSRNIAAFAQLGAEPFKRLKAVAGVRIEQYSLNNSNDKLVPILRAGINFRAAEYTFLRASFGQGYRYPSIAEKYAATTIGSIVIIPNPSIKPESGWSSEAGIKQGVSLGSLEGQADLAIFVTRNSGLIEYMFAAYEEGVGFKAVNREESMIAGAELGVFLSGSHSFFNYSITGGYTYIYPAEINDFTGRFSGEFLKYRRKHSAIISFNGSYKRFESGMSLTARSKILAIDEVFITTPILEGFDSYWPEHNKGFASIDLSGGYRFSDKYSISLIVKNLTNTEYMGRPGDIQPHRSISLRFTGNL